MGTKQDSKTGTDLPAYPEMYAHVLEENTTRALNLSSIMLNDRYVLYKQKDVQVSPEEHTTKIGVSFFRLIVQASPSTHIQGSEGATREL